MVSTKIKFIFGILLFLLASGNLFAADYAYELEQEIDEILLKKDLLEVINDAEKSPANDLESLYKRLILYRRAVNFEKILPVIKQILQTSREDKSGFSGGDLVQKTLSDEYFQDAETLRFYLQNSYYLSGDIFKKYTAICIKDKTACDVSGFENWLAQKVFENRDKEYDYESWFNYRLDWRESFGLDNTELLNQFAVDFRNNPGNLDKALRYLSRFNSPQTIAEIGGKFASTQACDHHVLGTRLILEGVYLDRNEADRKARIQFGIGFLEKSLQIPFNEKDKELMWKHYFSRTSIAPVIKNHEKQLRFWTKTRLAEIYRQNGEAHKAQPLVEELAKLDKSDISAADVSYLAGAVQADSGARVVEKKILSEQEDRKNSAAYWLERANYYRGRNEFQLVLEAYHEGLKIFPVKSNEIAILSARLQIINGLASFSQANFGKFVELEKDELEKDEDEEPEILSDETKQKARLWKKAENLLRTEFQTTKSNPHYSYSLIQIIHRSEFEDLLNEIFNQHTDQIVKIYYEIPIHGGDMFYVDIFLENETVSDAKKEEFLNRLFNIAQISNPKKTLKLISYLNCEDDSYFNCERDKFAARSIPVLHRNLEQIKEDLKSKNPSYIELENLEYLADDYLPVLFSAYISAKNWKGAEKFMQENYDWSEKFSYIRHEFIKRLAVAAAKNDDFTDAVRLWKIRANLDRRDLESLSEIAKFGEVRADLIEFYQKMRENEPYSPIPEKALNILK